MFLIYRKVYVIEMLPIISNVGRSISLKKFSEKTGHAIFTYGVAKASMKYGVPPNIVLQKIAIYKNLMNFYIIPGLKKLKKLTLSF